MANAVPAAIDEMEDRMRVVEVRLAVRRMESPGRPERRGCTTQHVARIGVADADRYDGAGVGQLRERAAILAMEEDRPTTASASTTPTTSSRGGAITVGGVGCTSPTRGDVGARAMSEPALAMMLVGRRKKLDAPKCRGREKALVAWP